MTTAVYLHGPNTVGGEFSHEAVCRVAAIGENVKDIQVGQQVLISDVDLPRYCTSSQKPFCAFVEVDGERKAKYKQLTNMKISEATIERLEDEGFRGPVRKNQTQQMDCPSTSMPRHTVLTAAAWTIRKRNFSLP